MKKTTYIIIGLLVANLLVVVAFFVALSATKHEHKQNHYDYESSEVEEVIEPEEYAGQPCYYEIVVEQNGQYFHYYFSYADDTSHYSLSSAVEISEPDSIGAPLVIKID